jgi:hypothetical protein
MSSLLMSVVALFRMCTSAALVCPYRLQLLYLAAACSVSNNRPVIVPELLLW